MATIYTYLKLNTTGFDKTLFESQKSLKSFKGTSDAMFGGLQKFTLWAAGLVSVKDVLQDAAQKSIAFEKSLSNLRAMTGVSAQELGYFRTEAIRLGSSTMQSASQVVDAFKLMGSQMPELLRNKAALTETTEAAILLAEASGDDVATAAKAVAGALNQMGASASHATEYVNILAAASQQGAAEIPYLNRAIEKAGGAASSVGVSFTELVAAIETIAPKVTEASEAGTGLRNMFLILEQQADKKLRPSVVGLTQALENLRAKHLDATEMTQMFGREVVTTALALTKETESFKQLAEGITGTNAAQEQARINNDNLAGSLTQLGSAWEGFVLALNHSNGALKTTVDYITKAVDGMRLAAMTPEEQLQESQSKYYSRLVKENVANASEDYEDYRKHGYSVAEASEKVADYVARRFTVSAEEVEQAKQKYLDAQKLVGSSTVEVGGMKVRLMGRPASQLKKKRADEADEAEKRYHKLQLEYDSQQGILSMLKEQAALEEKRKQAQAEMVKGVGEEAAARASAAAAEKAPAPEGSMARLNEQITKKREEVGLAISPESRIALSRELDALVGQKRYMQLEIEYGTQGGLKDTRQEQEMAEMKKYFSEVAKPPEGWDKIPEDPLPGLKKKTEDLQKFSEGLGYIGTAMNNLSGAFDEGTAGILRYFGNLTQSTAQAIQAINALIPAQKAMSNANAETAATGAAASVAGIPFVGAAMAVAAVASVIAALAAIPKFATGGIVGGSSYTGDKLFARVNSGEMILNQRQQRNLYRMTDGDRAGVDVRVSDVVVRGDKLRLVLGNTERRMKR